MEYSEKLKKTTERRLGEEKIGISYRAIHDRYMKNCKASGLDIEIEAVALTVVVPGLNSPRSAAVGRLQVRG
jgi:hypothetical protein